MRGINGNSKVSFSQDSHGSFIILQHLLATAGLESNVCTVINEISSASA